MSNTAPVLNVLAEEQSHRTIPAASSTLPKRFKGLAAIIAFTTSLPSRRICCQVWQSFLACKRAHIDNSALSRAPHDRENSASYFEHANQIYLNDLLPFASVELFERLESAEIPRIVNQDIDARRLPEHLDKGFCNFIRTRYIDGQGVRAVEFDGIHIPDPDLSAKSDELRGDSSANPPSPAGYDGRLAGKIVLVVHSASSKSGEGPNAPSHSASRVVLLSLVGGLAGPGADEVRQRRGCFEYFHFSLKSFG
jgi:hypothetical protein